MTREQIRRDVRYELVFVGLLVLLLGAGWMAAGPAIHLGPPSPYNPPTDPAYEMELYYGNADFTSIGGSITSHAFADCPNLVLLFDGARGFLSVGAVPAGGHVMFTPIEVTTLDGRAFSVSPTARMYLACEPSIDVI